MKLKWDLNYIQLRMLTIPLEILRCAQNDMQKKDFSPWVTKKLGCFFLFEPSCSLRGGVTRIDITALLA